MIVTTLLAVRVLHVASHEAESRALLVFGGWVVVAEWRGWWRVRREGEGRWFWGARPRQGIQSGTHLGLLILPWVLASRVRAEANTASSASSLFWFWTSLASGVFALAYAGFGGGGSDEGGGWRGVPLARATAVALATSAAGASRVLEVQTGAAAASASSSAAALTILIALHALVALLAARGTMRTLPGAETLAEALFTAQGAVLCAGHAAAVAAHAVAPGAWEWLPVGARGTRRGVQLAVAAAVLLACALLSRIPGFCGSRSERDKYRPLHRSAAGAGAVAAGAALRRPSAWLIGYVWNQPGLFRLAGYWGVTLGVSMVAIAKLSRRCPAGAKVAPISTVILRKTYHLLAVAMFLPPSLPRDVLRGMLPPPELLALAYAIALGLFAVAEVARVSRATVWVPGVGTLAAGAALQSFMSRFTDGRDAGESGIIISHFSLLLGLAVPLWVTREAWDGEGTAGTVNMVGAGMMFSLSPFAGIITLGLGDTAASVVGVTLGRHRLFDAWHKSVEGTLANACANVIGAALVWGVLHGEGSVPWGCVVTAGVGAAALEAVTEQLDNAFLPLYFLALTQLTAAL